MADVEPLYLRVADYSGAGDDTAREHVAQALDLCSGYTRGRGFEATTRAVSGWTGAVPDDLAAVAISVAARSADNPTGRRSHEFAVEGDVRTATSWAPTGALTLVEVAVLNRYRRRAA